MHRAAVPARARRGLLRPLPAMDLPFLILVLTLVGFGLVMLYSASSAVALYRRGDAWAYVRPQLLYAAMGIGAMWAASRVDYHIYHKLAWPLLALSLVLLVVVLFMPEYNGCKRWLVLPGLGTLQPSEIAKFAVVLVFAHIISLNHSRMESFAVGVVPFALVLGAVAVLMLLEPHLSGTVLILGIGAVLMFVGGTGLRWFVLAGVGGAGAIGAAIVIMPDLVPYAASRLSSWLDPFADPLGDGHQTIQSLYAIGSRGAGAGQQPPEAPVRAGTPERLHLFHPVRGAGVCGSLRGDPAVQSAAAAGRHAGGPRAGPLRGTAGGGVRGAGGLAGGAEHRRGHQHHPEHRHQPALLFLRRHQPDDAAGRDGHRAVRLPRGNIKAAISAAKWDVCPAKDAKNRQTTGQMRFAVSGYKTGNRRPSFCIPWGIFGRTGVFAWQGITSSRAGGR